MSENGRVLQAAKARVFKRILAPAGFVKGNKMFVRRAGGQVHAVEFQTSTWGGEYYVNVGFSYDFLPPLLAMTQQREIEYTKYQLLDLLMYVRLEHLMSYPYPHKWKYGRDENTEGDLELNSRNALGALDEFGGKWKDAAVFMEALPPELLEEDDREWERIKNLPDTERGAQMPIPVGAVLGGNGIYPAIVWHSV